MNRDRPRHSGTCIRSPLVLVVDDDAFVARALQRLLQAYAETRTASPVQALATLRSGARCDLILSDVTMPEMSGMEFYMQVAEHDGALAKRIIFMTGGVQDPRIAAFLEGVPNLLLEKPFDPEALRALVQRRLGVPLAHASLG